MTLNSMVLHTDIPQGARITETGGMRRIKISSAGLYSPRLPLDARMAQLGSQ